MWLVDKIKSFFKSTPDEIKELKKVIEKVEFEKAITVAFNNPQEFKEIHSGNQPVAHIKSTELQVASLAPSDTIWFRLVGPNYKRASATYSDNSAGMGTLYR